MDKSELKTLGELSSHGVGVGHHTLVSFISRNLTRFSQKISEKNPLVLLSKGTI